MVPDVGFRSSDSLLIQAVCPQSGGESSGSLEGARGVIIYHLIYTVWDTLSRKISIILCEDT